MSSYTVPEEAISDDPTIPSGVTLSATVAKELHRVASRFFMITNWSKSERLPQKYEDYCEWLADVAKYPPGALTLATDSFTDDEQRNLMRASPVDQLLVHAAILSASPDGASASIRTLPGGLPPVLTYRRLFDNNPAARRLLNGLVLGERNAGESVGAHSSVSSVANSIHLESIRSAVQVALAEQRRQEAVVSVGMLYSSIDLKTVDWLGLTSEQDTLRKTLASRRDIVEAGLSTLAKESDSASESIEILRKKLDKQSSNLQTNQADIADQIDGIEQHVIAFVSRWIGPELGEASIRDTSEEAELSAEDAWKVLHRLGEHAIDFDALTSKPTRLAPVPDGDGTQWQLEIVAPQLFNREAAAGLQKVPPVRVVRSADGTWRLRRDAFARLWCRGPAIVHADERAGAGQNGPAVETRIEADFGIRVSQFEWEFDAVTGVRPVALGRASWKVDISQLNETLHQRGLPAYSRVAEASISGSKNGGRLRMRWRLTTPALEPPTSARPSATVIPLEFDADLSELLTDRVRSRLQQDAWKQMDADALAWDALLAKMPRSAPSIIIRDFGVDRPIIRRIEAVRRSGSKLRVWCQTDGEFVIPLACDYVSNASGELVLHEVKAPTEFLLAAVMTATEKAAVIQKYVENGPTWNVNRSQTTDVSASVRALLKSAASESLNESLEVSRLARTITESLIGAGDAINLFTDASPSSTTAPVDHLAVGANELAGSLDSIPPLRIDRHTFRQCLRVRLEARLGEALSSHTITSRLQSLKQRYEVVVDEWSEDRKNIPRPPERDKVIVAVMRENIAQIGRELLLEQLAESWAARRLTRTALSEVQAATGSAGGWRWGSLRRTSIEGALAPLVSECQRLVEESWPKKEEGNQRPTSEAIAAAIAAVFARTEITWLRTDDDPNVVKPDFPRDFPDTVGQTLSDVVMHHVIQKSDLNSLDDAQLPEDWVPSEAEVAELAKSVEAAQLYRATASAIRGGFRTDGTAAKALREAWRKSATEYRSSIDQAFSPSPGSGDDETVPQAMGREASIVRNAIRESLATGRWSEPNRALQFAADVASRGQRRLTSALWAGLKPIPGQPAVESTPVLELRQAAEMRIAGLLQWTRSDGFADGLMHIGREQENSAHQAIVVATDDWAKEFTNLTLQARLRYDAVSRELYVALQGRPVTRVSGDGPGTAVTIPVVVACARGHRTAPDFSPLATLQQRASEFDEVINDADAFLTEQWRNPLRHRLHRQLLIEAVGSLSERQTESVWSDDQFSMADWLPQLQPLAEALERPMPSNLTDACDLVERYRDVRRATVSAAQAVSERARRMTSDWRELEAAIDTWDFESQMSPEDFAFRGPLAAWLTSATDWNPREEPVDDLLALQAFLDSDKWNVKTWAESLPKVEGVLRTIVKTGVPSNLDESTRATKTRQLARARSLLSVVMRLQDDLVALNKLHIDVSTLWPLRVEIEKQIGDWESSARRTDELASRFMSGPLANARELITGISEATHSLEKAAQHFGSPPKLLETFASIESWVGDPLVNEDGGLSVSVEAIERVRDAIDLCQKWSNNELDDDLQQLSKALDKLLEAVKTLKSLTEEAQRDAARKALEEAREGLNRQWMSLRDSLNEIAISLDRLQNILDVASGPFAVGSLDALDTLVNEWSDEALSDLHEALDDRIRSVVTGIQPVRDRIRKLRENLDLVSQDGVDPPRLADRLGKWLPLLGFSEKAMPVIPLVPQGHWEWEGATNARTLCWKFDGTEIIRLPNPKPLAVDIPMKDAEAALRSSILQARRELDRAVQQSVGELKSELVDRARELGTQVAGAATTAEDALKKLLPHELSLFGITLNNFRRTPQRPYAIDADLVLDGANKKRQLTALLTITVTDGKPNVSVSRLCVERLPEIKTAVQNFLDHELEMRGLRLTADPRFQDGRFWIAAEYRPDGFPFGLPIEFSWQLVNDNGRLAPGSPNVDFNLRSVIKLAVREALNHWLESEGQRGEPLGLGPIKLLLPDDDGDDPRRKYELLRDAGGDGFEIRLRAELEVTDAISIPFDVFVHPRTGVRVEFQFESAASAVSHLLNDALGDDLPLGLQFDDPAFDVQDGLRVFLKFRLEIPGLGAGLGGRITLSRTGIDFGDALRIKIPGWYDAPPVSFGNLGAGLDLNRRAVSLSAEISLSPGAGFRHIVRAETIGTLAFRRPVTLTLDGKVKLLSVLTLARSHIQLVPERGSFEITSRVSLGNILEFDGLLFIEALEPRTVLKGNQTEDANLYAAMDFELFGLTLSHVECGMNWDLRLWATVHKKLPLGEVDAVLEFDKGLSNPSFTFDAELDAVDPLASVRAHVVAKSTFVGVTARAKALGVPIEVFLEFPGLAEATPDRILEALLKLLKPRLGMPKLGITLHNAEDDPGSGKRVDDNPTAPSSVKPPEKVPPPAEKPLENIEGVTLLPWKPAWTERIETIKYGCGGFFIWSKTCTRQETFYDTVGKLEPIFGPQGHPLATAGIRYKAVSSRVGDWIATSNSSKQLFLYLAGERGERWKGRVHHHPGSEADRPHADPLFVAKDVAFFRYGNQPPQKLVAIRFGGALPAKDEDITPTDTLRDVSEIRMPSQANDETETKLGTPERLNANDYSEDEQRWMWVIAKLAMQGMKIETFVPVAEGVSYLIVGTDEAAKSIRRLIYVADAERSILINDQTSVADPKAKPAQEFQRALKNHAPALKRLLTLKSVEAGPLSASRPWGLFWADSAAGWKRAIVFETQSSSTQGDAFLLGEQMPLTNDSIGTWIVTTPDRTRQGITDVLSDLDTNNRSGVRTSLFEHLIKTQPGSPILFLARRHVLDKTLSPSDSAVPTWLRLGLSGISPDGHEWLAAFDSTIDSDSATLRQVQRSALLDAWARTPFLLPVDGADTLASSRKFLSLVLKGDWRDQGWQANPYGSLKRAERSATTQSTTVP